MNMKQLKYVLVLAKEGSFSKAADALDITQPSLSQYIKKIEKELGVELFDRANGNVRLTSAGKVYVETGRKILDMEHQMQNRLTDISEYKEGAVVIGTTPFRSATMMPLVVAEFNKYYPGMHIVVDERGTQELQEAAERGEFDLCVLTAPVDERIFKSEQIIEEELVVAVPKGSVLAEKLRANSAEISNRKYKAVDARILDGEAFVMITDTQVMQKTLNNLCRDYNLHLNKATVVKSLEAQIEMVRQGIGAALVPTGIQKNGEVDERIQYFSLAQELPHRQVVVIYRKEQYITEVTKTLIEIMKGINDKGRDI